jgi:hypothetical protein
MSPNACAPPTHRYHGTEQFFGFYEAFGQCLLATRPDFEHQALAIGHLVRLLARLEVAELGVGERAHVSLVVSTARRRMRRKAHGHGNGHSKDRLSADPNQLR